MNITFTTSFDTFQEAIDFLIRLLPLLIPLFIVQYGLLIFVIVDIVKKKTTKTLNPPFWLIIAIFFNSLCIGSVLYLIFGRAEKTYDGKDDDI